MMKNFYLKFGRLLILSILLVLPATKAAAQYGSVDWAQLVGGSGYDYPYDLQVVDGYTYISGRTSSPNMPVTNGSIFQGVGDFYIAKYNSAGTLLFGSYIGGNGYEEGAETPGKNFQVVGDNVYLSGWTTSTNLPVTNGSSLNGPSDIFFVKMNTSTGAVEMCTYLGSSGDDPYPIFKVHDGNIFFTISSEEVNFPVTDGSFLQGGLDMVIAKLDGSTGNLVWSKFIGGDLQETVGDIEVDDDNVYIGGYSNSSYASFPSTDGTVATNSQSYFYLKLNALTGEPQFMTYLASPTALFGNTELLLENGNVYALVNSRGAANVITTDGSADHGLYDIVAARFDASSNNLIYKTIIGGNGSDVLERNTVVVKNGNLYIGARSISTDYPVTNGSSINNAYDLIITKLNSSGQIVFASYAGGTGNEYCTDLEIGCNNEIYVLSTPDYYDYPVTNGSASQHLNGGIALSKFDGVTGNLVFSSFFGSSALHGSAVAMDIVSDGIVQITGSGSNAYAPVTMMGAGGSTDMLLMQVNTCPSGYTGSLTLSPATQSVCINGVVGMIAGEKSSILPSSLATLYTNGVPSYQEEIPATYQWQVSDSPSGPWTDLVGATEQNYTPAAGSTTKYYRRLVQTYCCGEPVIHQTSEVAEVVVTSNQAPIANAGGIFNTCVGSAVTLGSATIATGGTSPYTVLWDNGLGNVEQPTVSPVVASVYTLKITDANGCVDYDQAIVNPFKADAGVDVGNCAGAGVRIGSAPIAGVSGVTYAWAASPADASMSCTACAQPTVSPTVVTTYTLTLTIPITGGGTCTTTDEVIVTPVAAPVTANFAGPDKAICLGGTATLGLAAESGFTYTWAPGNYLVSNNTSIVTFQPGNLTMPSPNPMHYYVTAVKNGCSFVDQVEVSAIEANAGVDGCGPRYIGTADRTPDINETYSWTKISGPGNFSGPTNLPTVPVTASVGGSTTYQLTVSYTVGSETATCTDEVVVPECGCVVLIEVEAPYSCPNYTLNDGNVSLRATGGSGDPNLYTYTWSPAAGLSSATGRTVTLTDNIERTYTVTISSPLDPSVNCSQTITVNKPAWSLPVFNAQDGTICAGGSVAIGEATVAGYSYLWTGNNLSGTTISNPIATPASSTTYTVLVTDIESGCTVRDTAVVTIATPIANAGPDVLICNSAEVTLGTPAQPNTTYSWSPSGGITYLNGTSSTSAQPQFLVATTSTYTVTATNTLSGCTSSDEVTVTIGTPVAPFTLPDINYCPSGPVTLNPGGIPAGMTSYRWTPTTGLSSSTVVSPTLTTPPSAGATYLLTVTNASGCTYSAQQTIVPNVTAPLVAPNQLICYNSNPALNSSVQIGGAAVSGATYSWSPTTGLDDPTSSNPTYTPSGTGIVIFTVTKMEGGCPTTAKVIITSQNMTIPAMSNPTVCENTSVEIGTPNVYGVTYSWSPTTGLSDPTISNPVATVGNSTVQYTLTATGLTGCVDKAIVSVGVNPVPAPEITVLPVTACSSDGTTSFEAVVTPAGSYDYQWSPNDGTLSSIYVANPDVNITGIGSKTYQLTVTNTATGCANATNAVLTVNFCAPVLVSLGSTAFVDLNNDGVQSGAGEVGIGGLLVKLYAADGTTLIASTFTDEAGNYLFSGLPEGSYVVGVTPNSAYPSASTPPPGSDDQVDSDNNGTQAVVGGESKSSVIVLIAGTEPVGESGQGGVQDDLNDSNGDMTIDFGFFVPTTFPVDLINFKAAVGEHSVELSWRTANEKSFSHFELQRSVDGKEFSSIAQIKGSQATIYSYRDRKPLEGYTYYRLKMVDTDGSSSLSRIIQVNYHSSDNYLLVENPAVQSSFVVMTNTVNPELQLLSLSGVVQPISVVQSAAGRYVVRAPQVSSGIFILKVNGEKSTLIRKVIFP